MRFRLATLLCATALSLASARAQEPSADLVARAKAEGKVVYYTDLIVDQMVRPLVAAFEAKYGVTVEYSRGDSQDTILKILNEHRAGHMQADVFGLTSGLKSLIDAGAVRRFTPPNAAALPAQFRDADHYWVSSNYYVMTPAINTDLAPRPTWPASYEDLLAPQWRDKMVWKPNDISGAPGFIGNVLRTMGDERGMEYLRKLSGQKIASVNASARAVLDQVIAGEHTIALQIFNHHAALSAKKGAPSQWLKIEPAMVQMTIEVMTANSAHPAAAELLVDFMLSPQGQALFKQADYFPTRQDVTPSMPELAPTTGGFKANFFGPSDIDQNYERWAKIYIDLFR